MLRVLGRITSINVRKVTFVLDELEIRFEREEWGLPLRDPKLPEFLTLNPNGQVPVLIEDEFVLWESQPIMRYLAAKAGSDLWPLDLRERALVDQWLTWQSTELNAVWRYAVYALIRRAEGFADKAAINASWTGWTEKMRLLDTHLGKTGPYLANKRFSLADIVIALSTHRWLAIPLEKADLPNLMAHYEGVRARPAAAAALRSDTP